MRVKATDAVWALLAVAGVLATASCGSSATSSISAAAINCDLTDYFHEGELTLSSEDDLSRFDVDCVLMELMDKDDVIYFNFEDFPAIGDRELRDGVWVGWWNGADKSFVWKFADSQSAATS